MRVRLDHPGECQCGDRSHPERDRGWRHRRLREYRCGYLAGSAGLGQTSQRSETGTAEMSPSRSKAGGTVARGYHLFSRSHSDVGASAAMPRLSRLIKTLSEPICPSPGPQLRPFPKLFRYGWVFLSLRPARSSAGQSRYENRRPFRIIRCHRSQSSTLSNGQELASRTELWRESRLGP